LSKNIYLNRFTMRPCNRYIKYNLKYFILKQFELYVKYIFTNYNFYLLIVTEVDWRRVRIKKKSLNALLFFKKKSWQNDNVK